MADTAPVRVFHIVGTAYQDLVRVFKTLRRLIVVAALILVGLQLFEYLFLDGWLGVPVFGWFVALAFVAAKSFLIAPFLIAVHRFILVHEVTERYAFDFHDRRLLLFFVNSFALAAFGIAIAMLNSLLAMFAVFSPLATMLHPGVTIFVAVVVTSVAAMVVILRLAILFPAIAVDAGGANASNAFEDTKGHTLKVVATFVVASLPVVAIYLVLALIGISSSHSLNSTRSGSFIGTLVTALVYAGTLPLLIALASRLYQVLGDKVLAPASG